MDISKFMAPKKTEEEAYLAGVDCAKNGPNTENCHFSFFSSVEKMQAWERGKQSLEIDLEATFGGTADNKVM